MIENLRSLDSLPNFKSASLENTRRAHIFAIFFGKLLQRNIVEPTDVVRAWNTSRSRLTQNQGCRKVEINLYNGTTAKRLTISV